MARPWLFSPKLPERKKQHYLAVTHATCCLLEKCAFAMVISRDEEPEQNKSLALDLNQNYRWILVFINSKKFRAKFQALIQIETKA